MGGKIGWDEDKKICTVDDKKGCLLIFYKQFIPTEYSVGVFLYCILLDFFV